MSRFALMAVAIIIFTALTSFISLAVLPFSLGRFEWLFAIFKILLVTVWLAAAYRVKRQREEMTNRRLNDGTLWEREIDPRDFDVSEVDFDVIRYHFDSDENIIRVARQHKIVLIHAFIFLGLSLLLVLITVGLATYYPVATYRFPGLQDFVPAKTFRITVWWVPTLPVLICFYAGLSHWQGWKWTIRVVTDKHFYILREQSTYMPWTGKFSRPIQIHQIVQVIHKANSLSGMFGWTELELQVRADEADDEKEKILIDYVKDGSQFEHQLRDAMSASPA